MKKLILLTTIVVFGFTNMNAQGQFSAGISGGIPIGDAADFTTFAIAVDLGYLFDLSDEFQAGPVAGVSHFFGDSDETDEDFTWIPIGGGIRYLASEEFTIGLDIGYAIGAGPEDIDSGFSFGGFAGYDLGGGLSILAGYDSISLDGGSFDTVNAGLRFDF